MWKFTTDHQHSNFTKCFLQSKKWVEPIVRIVLRLKSERLVYNSIVHAKQIKKKHELSSCLWEALNYALHDKMFQIFDILQVLIWSPITFQSLPVGSEYWNSPQNENSSQIICEGYGLEISLLEVCETCFSVLAVMILDKNGRSITWWGLLSGTWSTSSPGPCATEINGCTRLSWLVNHSSKYTQSTGDERSSKFQRRLRVG